MNVDGSLYSKKLMSQAVRLAELNMNDGLQGLNIHSFLSDLKREAPDIYKQCQSDIESLTAIDAAKLLVAMTRNVREVDSDGDTAKLRD